MSIITEKKIYKVSPIALTSNGTQTGSFTIPDSSIFRVGQIIILRSNSQSPLELKVKRIDPVDHVTLWVGPIKQNIASRTDISAFLVADNATIEANEQERPSVPEQEVERITYEEEPTAARRVILVDPWGCRINADNPLPISGTVIIDGSTSSTPTIYNVNAVTAGVEYSQVLPSGTTQFSIKARNNAKLQISYQAGQTNTVFLTITPGTIYSVASVKLVGKTLYFMSTKDDTIVEMIVWN